MNNCFLHISPHYGQNIHISPPWSTLHIFQYTITENAPINSLTCIINPNNFFLSHMEIFIIHPFWQNLHNIQFQANDIFNIHNPTNSIQIIIFNSRINHIHVYYWNPRLCAIHVHTPNTWIDKKWWSNIITPWFIPKITTIT